MRPRDLMSYSEFINRNPEQGTTNAQLANGFHDPNRDPASAVENFPSTNHEHELSGADAPSSPDFGILGLPMPDLGEPEKFFPISANTSSVTPEVESSVIDTVSLEATSTSPRPLDIKKERFRKIARNALLASAVLDVDREIDVRRPRTRSMRGTQAASGSRSWKTALDSSSTGEREYRA